MNLQVESVEPRVPGLSEGSCRPLIDKPPLSGDYRGDPNMWALTERAALHYKGCLDKLVA